MIIVGIGVKMQNKIYSNMKFIIWIFVNIVILIYGTYLREIASDGAIIFVYLLYVISFPLGLIVPFVFVCIDKCIGYDINIYYDKFPVVIDIFVPWILFLIAGYLQWFILIPRIKKWWLKEG
jgi:hypothetical protein